MKLIPWAVSCYAAGIFAARIVNGPEWFLEEGAAVLLWPVIVMIALTDQLLFQAKIRRHQNRKDD